jgi:hypothetical protein
MATITSIQQLNRNLAEQINADALRDPQSPDSGKFVGIANGKVIVIADNWDDVVEQLERAEPDAAKTLCFEVGRDYNTPQEIWEAV